MTNTKKVISASIDMEAGLLTITCNPLGQSITIDPAEMDAMMNQRATLHGYNQKLIDAAAIARDGDSGRSATVTEKWEAILTVYDRLRGVGDYTAPSWNEPREGNGPQTGLLLSAIVRMNDGKKSREEVKAWLDLKGDDEKAALRKNPKVAKVIDQIRLERAKTDGIDSDALLEEMLG